MDRGGLRWFGEMEVEPGLAAAAPVVLVPPTGQRHEHGPLEGRLCAEPPGDLVAAHTGEPDVEERQIGAESPGHVQGVGAVMGDRGAVAPKFEQRCDRLGGVLVVVDHEDSVARAHPFVYVAGRRRRRCRRVVRGEREPDDEGAPRPWARAVGCDAPAVHLDQALDERQADAQTARRARPRGIDLYEHVEDVEDPIGGDTDAAVAHPDDGLLALLLHAESNVATIICELAGIVQEIAHHLGQAGRVRVEDDRARRQTHGQLVVSLLVDGMGGLDGVVNAGRELHALTAELDRPPTDAAHVQQVVHEPHDLTDVPLHDHGRRADGLAIPVGQPQDLQRVADRGEGVAELVGQHRQELVLTAVAHGHVGRVSLQLLLALAHAILDALHRVDIDEHHDHAVDLVRQRPVRAQPQRIPAAELVADILVTRADRVEHLQQERLQIGDAFEPQLAVGERPSDIGRYQVQQPLRRRREPTDTQVRPEDDDGHLDAG